MELSEKPFVVNVFYSLLSIFSQISLKSQPELHSIYPSSGDIARIFAGYPDQISDTH
ncbi:20422_t:CDS:2 [Rhizophagus irregularis]|nr:20422_t:CDS:2 [Rhizophagus irregularis]